MILELKKSRITDWWVADRNDKMNFINILSSNPLSGDFVVMGYLDKTTDLAHSTNSVIRITKRGVITAQGTFYPFKEAHPLYLNFLLKANKDNTIIASYWKILDSKTNTMIANIITTEGTMEKVTFDFIPDNKSRIMFFGHSNQLSADVVLCTFRRNGYCTILGIPEAVTSDIARSRIILKEDLSKILEQIKTLFIKKFNDSYISVSLT